MSQPRILRRAVSLAISTSDILKLSTVPSPAHADSRWQPSLSIIGYRVRAGPSPSPLGGIQAFMVVPMIHVRDNHHVRNRLRKNEIRGPRRSMNSASPFSAAATTIISSINQFPLLALVNPNANVNGVQSSHQEDEPPPPPPPWRFQASRIHYQLRAIPTHVAQKYGPSSSSVVRLLSLGGYTLGGVFVVEYELNRLPLDGTEKWQSCRVSSWQIYKSWNNNMGAWASHLFVDVPNAATYGRDYWGLAAQTVPTIDMRSQSFQWFSGYSNNSDASRRLSSSSTCDIHFAANQTIQVSGWWNTTSKYHGTRFQPAKHPSFHDECFIAQFKWMFAYYFFFLLLLLLHGNNRKNKPFALVSTQDSTPRIHLHFNNSR
eukprot:scaffold11851_cov58-Attheya_sp.AAC.1